ncbi:MAG: serine/threonine-protein kinase [Verrucomicrobiota bacterium]
MHQPSFNAPAIEALARLLPAYDFECLIAKGGMGAVYKAKQRSLGRDVAIKVLPPEVGHDPMFRRSFETEARAMARLNHPNLIGVYDSGSVADMLYIVMEYVPGKSLYHSSYGKMVDPVQAVQLIQGICAGLSHAHENGIIHSDIKPANILLTPKAEPKIGDFGLARLVESEGTGLVMGTPGYTAPEVVANPNVADHRSDLFSVGVMLYELMAGKRQEAGAAPPSTICGCGPGIDEIWRRATDLNPANRYQTANALRAALADWLTAKDSPGKRKAAVSASAPQGKASPAASQGGAKPKPMANVATQAQARPQGSGLYTGLQFLALAALIGISAYLWKGRMDHDKDMVKIAEKNTQTLEEFKRLQEGGGKGSRSPAAGISRQPNFPSLPNKTPAAPVKVATPGKQPDAHPTPPSADPVDSAVLSSLTARAKELIGAADKKRTEQLAANARLYSWDLDLWVHTLTKNGQASWQLPVARLKSAVRGVRVPVGIPQANGFSVTPQMAQIVADCAAKQGQIDATFLIETDKLRAFYLSRLKDEAASAEKAGQSEAAATLRAASAQAADNEAWIRSFGFDPRPASPGFTKENSDADPTTPAPRSGAGA